MVPLLVFVLITIQAYCVSAQDYKVPNNIDVEEIIKNDRLTKNYVDCVLGKGKCTSEGEQLKKVIPDALENDCANCDEKQREAAKKVLHHLIEKKPEWWKELTEKFDPQGRYKQKYTNYLKEEGLAY